MSLFFVAHLFSFVYSIGIMELISCQEAAEILGISKRRVLALINSGHLPAKKVGRQWVIVRDHLKLVEDRKPGRPKQKD
jgi:excisionase family DNA binding protein